MRNSIDYRHPVSTQPPKLLQILGVTVLAIAAFALTALAQQYYQWSGWIGTNAPSIDYRYELTGPYIVMIQFRNKTDKAITIDYAVWLPGQDKPQKGNLHIDSNSTGAGNNIQTTKGQPPSRVEVQVN
ncbi:MAG: hypothetical protein WBF09_21950 [Candidatus Acidiferrum sp.]